MKVKVITVVITLLTLFAVGLLLPRGAAAHCDTLDGPVVQAAREALDTGNLNPVLAWVADQDVPEVQAAFAQARTVRTLGPEAQEMADHYFFETLVRVHRASEGAPYTGLKPAGTDLGPVVPQADRALETGTVDELTALVSATVQEGIRERFNDVASKKNYDKNDVQAGREYVEAYVTYMHYVEGIYDASAHQGADHHAAGADTSEQESAHQETVSAQPAPAGRPDLHSAPVNMHQPGETTTASTVGLPRTGGQGNNDSNNAVLWALGGGGLIGLGWILHTLRGRKVR